MGRGTLGNPRVKESKVARQARLMRALEHRVRRLEKVVLRPPLVFDPGKVSPEDIEALRQAHNAAVVGQFFEYSGKPIDVDSLLGEQVLRPCSEPFNSDALFDRIESINRATNALITEAKDRQEIAARLSRETQQRIRAQADSACPGKSRTRRAALLARLRGLLGRLWRGGRS